MHYEALQTGEVPQSSSSASRITSLHEQNISLQTDVCRDPKTLQSLRSEIPTFLNKIEVVSKPALNIILSDGPESLPAIKPVSPRTHCRRSFPTIHQGSLTLKTLSPLVPTIHQVSLTVHQVSLKLKRLSPLVPHLPPSQPYIEHTVATRFSPVIQLVSSGIDCRRSFLTMGSHQDQVFSATQPTAGESTRAAVDHYYFC